jgi:site-specific recombinase XerD
MDTCSLIQDFLVYLDAERGYSPYTVKSYRGDLRSFFSFAVTRDVTEVGDVTTLLVREWISSLRTGGLAHSSIARHLYALRSFWSFLLDSEAVAGDPLKRISIPKQKHSLPATLSVAELRVLLAAAEQHPNPVVGFRDYAIVCMLAFTGMRRGELLAMDVDHVSLEGSVVHVKHGKGGRSRIIPLAEEAVSAIRDWLDVRPKSKTEALFVTVRGNRIYPSRLQVIWRRVLEQSGVCRPGVTLHTLRHSFATLLLQNGANLFAIQKLLGHSRLDTTAFYLRMGDDDLRAGVERHPLSSAGRV